MKWEGRRMSKNIEDRTGMADWSEFMRIVSVKDGKTSFGLSDPKSVAGSIEKFSSPTTTALAFLGEDLGLDFTNRTKLENSIRSALSRKNENKILRRYIASFKSGNYKAQMSVPAVACVVETPLEEVSKISSVLLSPKIDYAILSAKLADSVEKNPFLTRRGFLSSILGLSALSVLMLPSVRKLFSIAREDSSYETLRALPNFEKEQSLEKSLRYILIAEKLHQVRVNHTVESDEYVSKIPVVTPALDIIPLERAIKLGHDERMKILSDISSLLSKDLKQSMIFSMPVLENFVYDEDLGDLTYDITFSDELEKQFALL